MDNRLKMIGKKPFEYYIFKLEKDSIIPAENGAKKNQRFRCDICSAIFKRGFSLKRHYLRFHINVIYINERDLANCGITPAETTETGLYKCHDCSTHFEVKDELMDHRNSYHVNGRKPGLNYFCDRCSMSFTNKHNFLSHVKRACQKEDVKVCPHCQKEYARKGRLEKHMQHCKNENCRKSAKSLEEAQILKVTKLLLPQSLNGTFEESVDYDSKSVCDSGEESDSNSRSSFVNDFSGTQTYPDFKIDQESTDGLFDIQYDLGQSVERYVRDDDDKVFLVLDAAKPITSQHPFDDPNFYNVDYPFRLEELGSDINQDLENFEEPSHPMLDLKFSAESDSQDIFVHMSKIPVAAPVVALPQVKTYASKSHVKLTTISVKQPAMIDAQPNLMPVVSCVVGPVPDSKNTGNSPQVVRVNGCDDRKPKVVLDKLMTLIQGAGVFDIVQESSQDIQILSDSFGFEEYIDTAVQKSSVGKRQLSDQDQAVPSLVSHASIHETNITSEVIIPDAVSRTSEEDYSQGEPLSKKQKVDEEGRKSHLLRSKHTCPECGKSFGKPGKMVSHRRLAHGSQGVKTKIDSFSKFHYLPLWSPRRDESTEPPPERLEHDSFSLEYVNSCCEENISLFVDGQICGNDPSLENPKPQSDRLSWKHHSYLQRMSTNDRNQFLSDMVRLPLAEQFEIHAKINPEPSPVSTPSGVLGSLGLQKSNLIVPENNDPQVFEGLWSQPKCFVCRACGMRSKDWYTYDSHRTYSHPLVFCSHIVLDLKSAEVPRELWSQWALGHRLLRGSSKRKARRHTKSLATPVSTSIDLTESEGPVAQLRRLRSSSALVISKSGKAEIPKTCTKCRKRGMNLLELHAHILECGKKEKIESPRSSVPSLGSSKKKQFCTLKGRHGMKRKIPSHQEFPKKQLKKKNVNVSLERVASMAPSRHPESGVSNTPDFQTFLAWLHLPDPSRRKRLSGILEENLEDPVPSVNLSEKRLLRPKTTLVQDSARESASTKPTTKSSKAVIDGLRQSADTIVKEPRRQSPSKERFEISSRSDTTLLIRKKDSTTNPSEIAFNNKKKRRRLRNVYREPKKRRNKHKTPPTRLGQTQVKTEIAMLQGDTALMSQDRGDIDLLTPSRSTTLTLNRARADISHELFATPLENYDGSFVPKLENNSSGAVKRNILAELATPKKPAVSSAETEKPDLKKPLECCCRSSVTAKQTCRCDENTMQGELVVQASTSPTLKESTGQTCCGGDGGHGYNVLELYEIVGELVTDSPSSNSSLRNTSQIPCGAGRLVPEELEPNEKESNCDSGYATCTNSNDQFQLKAFPSEYLWVNESTMPCLSMENPFKGSSADDDEVSGMSSADPPELVCYQTSVEETQVVDFPVSRPDVAFGEDLVYTVL